MLFYNQPPNKKCKRRKALVQCFTSVSNHMHGTTLAWPDWRVKLRIIIDEFKKLMSTDFNGRFWKVSIFIPVGLKTAYLTSFAILQILHHKFT